MRALLIVALLGSAAHADDSFETKAQGAQRIGNLGDLAWALTATCEAGEDVQQRQCRHLRDTRMKELATATFLVDAQASSFEVGTWSAAKKSIPVTLNACIDCKGITVNGKNLFVTGSQPIVEGGAVHATRLLDTTRQFGDEGSAKAWLTAAKSARVQLLVKVPEKARWQISGKEGLTLDIVGYRVYSPCEGTVFVASPSSGPVETDKKACAKK